MELFSFDEIFWEIVKSCVQSSSFSIVMEESSSDVFQAQRGGEIGRPLISTPFCHGYRIPIEAD